MFDMYKIRPMLPSLRFSGVKHHLYLCDEIPKKLSYPVTKPCIALFSIPISCDYCFFHMNIPFIAHQYLTMHIQFIAHQVDQDPRIPLKPGGFRVKSEASQSSRPPAALQVAAVALLAAALPAVLPAVRVSSR